jgi:hypothetical protein
VRHPTASPQRDSPTVHTERQRTLLAALGDTHSYTGDGTPDANGRDRCAVLRCGLPASHPVHGTEATR